MVRFDSDISRTKVEVVKNLIGSPGLISFMGGLLTRFCFLRSYVRNCALRNTDCFTGSKWVFWKVFVFSSMNSEEILYSI